MWMGSLRIIEYSYDLTNKYYYVPIRIVPDPLTEDYVPTDEDLFWMFAGKEPSELNIRWAFREIRREVDRKFKILGVINDGY